MAVNKYSITYFGGQKMKMEFPVEQTVKNRHSVRTYSDKPISPETRAKLEAYIDTLYNPFSASVKFSMLESEAASNSAKLGTYGMIQGAKEYFGATVGKNDFALEGLGYEFEKLILFAASLDLGTCWLGGTFNRSEFAIAMDVSGNDLFPAISPIGYPAGKKRLKESLMRKVIKADQRKPWEDLFFNRNFSTPLSRQDAGEYSFPLEMMILAPSASNKQPWRIVKDEKTYHFFEASSPGYGERLGFDIQKVDLGIAACHFHMAAMEKDLKGEFKFFMAPEIDMPDHTKYLFSWVAE